MTTKTSRSRKMSHLDLIIKARHMEQAAVNRAIQHGATVKLNTAFGEYELDYVSADFWYHTKGDWLTSRSFMGCADSQWFSILRQAGVEEINPDAL